MGKLKDLLIEWENRAKVTFTFYPHHGGEHTTLTVGADDVKVDVVLAHNRVNIWELTHVERDMESDLEEERNLCRMTMKLSPDTKQWGIIGSSTHG